jgi:hypothetical protein
VVGFAGIWLSVHLSVEASVILFATSHHTTHWAKMIIYFGVEKSTVQDVEITKLVFGQKYASLFI